MSPVSRSWPWLALLPLGVAPAQNQPHIGFVYPAGMQAGTTGEFTVGGKNLQGVSRAWFSGIGMLADVLEHTRPMTQQERNQARERLQQLQAKRQKERLTADEEKLLAELRDQLATNPRAQPNPQIAETVRLRLVASADARTGARELRLVTPAGISNPLRFELGTLREHREVEPNEDSPDAGAAEPPVVIDGQILPGDRDRFRIRATKGSRLVAAVRARELMPYLADAVPGWFQATLALGDARGRQLAFVDDHAGSPDPRLELLVPEDGEYVLEVRDALWRGREDFVYRLTLGAEEEPVRADDSRMAAGVPSTFAGLREVHEQEPDDDLAHAQRIEPPLVVSGCVARPGDLDVYALHGRAGERLVAEVLARRCGSPLDSLLRVLDARGAELFSDDDHADAGYGLVTHQADSLLSFRLPADGTYYVQVADTQHGGGAEHRYRLRVGPPRPDFALRVVPSGINVRAGGTAVVTVHALRADGFSGEIALALADAPPGFVLSGAVVPPGQDSVRMTLAAPAQAPDLPVTLRLVGRAPVAGTQVERPAVPAEDMMQAFAYRHLVPAEELLCLVLRGGPPGASLALAGKDAARIPAGGSVEVQLVAVLKRPLPEGLDLVLNEPPPGITLGGVKPVPGGLALVVRADATKVKVGQRGNLIVDAFLERGAASRDQKQPARRQRNPIGTLPAIAFEVVGAGSGRP